MAQFYKEIVPSEMMLSKKKKYLTVPFRKEKTIYISNRAARKEILEEKLKNIAG